MQAGCREFKSRTLHHFPPRIARHDPRPHAEVAQLVERQISNLNVAGSTPVLRSRHRPDHAPGPEMQCESLAATGLVVRRLMTSGSGNDAPPLRPSPGTLAQLVERLVYTEDVGSSSLSGPTNTAGPPALPFTGGMEQGVPPDCKSDGETHARFDSWVTHQHRHAAAALRRRVARLAGHVVDRFGRTAGFIQVPIAERLPVRPTSRQGCSAGGSWTALTAGPARGWPPL